mmetsp:Transcript_53069/g.133412  ORF Transcript_53069/g.133412 Transcript_53069/m.133412 type:complete len:82 (+) Transcript_53069:39-284(+)
MSRREPSSAPWAEHVVPTNTTRGLDSESERSAACSECDRALLLSMVDRPFSFSSHGVQTNKAKPEQGQTHKLRQSLIWIWV